MKNTRVPNLIYLGITCPVKTLRCFWNLRTPVVGFKSILSDPFMSLVPCVQARSDDRTLRFIFLFISRVWNLNVGDVPTSGMYHSLNATCFCDVSCIQTNVKWFQWCLFNLFSGHSVIHSFSQVTFGSKWVFVPPNLRFPPFAYVGFWCRRQRSSTSQLWLRLESPFFNNNSVMTLQAACDNSSKLLQHVQPCCNFLEGLASSIPCSNYGADWPIRWFWWRPSFFLSSQFRPVLSSLCQGEPSTVLYYGRPVPAVGTAHTLGYPKPCWTYRLVPWEVR